MPQLRHKTIRSRLNTKARKETSAEDKLRAIRALYIIVYNGTDSVIPCAVELFHSIGDILEGTPLEQLELHRVPKEKVLDVFSELSNT